MPLGGDLEEKRQYTGWDTLWGVSSLNHILGAQYWGPTQGGWAPFTGWKATGTNRRASWKPGLSLWVVHKHWLSPEAVQRVQTEDCTKGYLVSHSSPSTHCTMSQVNVPAPLISTRNSTLKLKHHNQRENSAMGHRGLNQGWHMSVVGVATADTSIGINSGAISLQWQSDHWNPHPIYAESHAGSTCPVAWLHNRE